MLLKGEAASPIYSRGARTHARTRARAHTHTHTHTHATHRSSEIKDNMPHSADAPGYASFTATHEVIKAVDMVLIA
jgi:hypothetical protein